MHTYMPKNEILPKIYQTRQKNAYMPKQLSIHALNVNLHGIKCELTCLKCELTCLKSGPYMPKEWAYMCMV